jgi:hypothetical protein
MIMNPDESRIARALAADVGNQYIKRRKERDEPASDPSIFGVTDWATEFLFEDLSIMDPEFKENKYFKHLYGTFRDKQVATFLQRGGKDSLGGLAILYTKVDNGNDFNVIAFWDFLKHKGPERQGDVVEIYGPMGAGKSNFMVWLILTSELYGFYTLSNIKLNNPGKRYKEVHSLSDVLFNLADIREKDKNAMILIMIDEQAASRGSGSRTATTKETRWSDKFITIIRKFGASLWRSRQFDSAIKEQRELITIEFNKDTAHLDQAHGEIKQGLYSGTKIFFDNIKNMGKEFDTKQLSSFNFDLDMEMFDKLAAKKEGQISNKYTMEDLVIDVVKTMKNDESKKNPERVLELAAEGYTVEGIINETGYSKTQIYRILNDNGSK